MLCGCPFSGSPPSKFEAAPKIPLKIKIPITRQITIANADTTNGNPPDVFFVLIVVFYYLLVY
jgi:hypothetical protein